MVNLGIREDIEALHADGITVDDNNDPAPENVPLFDVSNNGGGRGRGGGGRGGRGGGGRGDVDAVLATGTWVTPNTCSRQITGATNREGRWIHNNWDELAHYDELDTWLVCFPMRFLIDVVVPSTNPHLKMGVTTINEITTYLGLREYMSCFVGVEDYREWWSRDPPSMWKGAPWRFNEFMSISRFDDITASLRYAKPETISLFSDP